MKEETENIELIEAFVEGLLSHEENQRVKQLLENDPSFREEFEMYNAFVARIRDRNEPIIRTKLHEIDRELDSGNSSGIIHISKSKWFTNRYAIAASLILFLLASSIAVYYSYFNPKAVFSENYIQDPGLPVLMGADGSLKLGQAMNFYKLENFESSFQLLNQLYLENSGNDTLQYYSGVLLLSLNKPSEAIRYFQECLSNASSSFHVDSEYRLATAYFLNGQKASAKDIFKEIAASANNPYRESAVQFLKHI